MDYISQTNLVEKHLAFLPSVKKLRLRFMEAVAQALSDHVRQADFPCIMAKAVERVGGIRTLSIPDLLADCDISELHKNFCDFIDDFRRQDGFRSFILICPHETYSSFKFFEEHFWNFLKTLRDYDQRFYPHDPRVHSDPAHKEFSFSIKSEAFFILMLHPRSPRWARRFKYPAIVFNPHEQFEKLRTKGIFKKIKNVIRHRDFMLQGSINPMLSDFGERSEVFQYVGKAYGPDENVPLFI